MVKHINKENKILKVNYFRLAWIKVNIKKNGKSLIEIAEEVCNRNKNYEILNLLNDYSLGNDFIHTVFAIDFDLMQDLSEDKKSFNANIAEFAYIFSWFKPIFRNFPKFLLETALDTKQPEIVLTVLGLGANVNFFHSKNGNPFYYLAFEPEYHNLKQDLLANANYSVKNHRGQNILFHLFDLYIQNIDNKYYCEVTFKDFYSIMTSNPILITQRDETDLTLYETILGLEPNLFMKSTDILIQISNFLQGIINEKDFDLIQEMFFDGYGHILLNTKVDFNNESNSLLLKDNIKKTENDELNKLISNLFDFYFESLVVDFFKAIRMGDLANLKIIIDLDEKKILTKFKDYSGRSCLHLAILHNRPTIFK